MKAIRVGLVLLMMLAAVEMVIATPMQEISGIQTPVISDEEADDLKSIEEKLPSFRPSISDKRGMRPTETSPPLPESELTHIPFPKTWLLENDADENPDLVRVTFPASWIDNPPEVSSDEPIVLLRVPKKMLRLDDLNEDPELITIHYPKEWFSYPTSEDLNPVPVSRINDSISQRSTVSGIEFQKRVWFRNEEGYNVIHATGILDPYYFYNTGETFRTFHEREVYFNRDGDLIEFISDFASDGKAWVWVAVFDENEWVTDPNWLSIEVTGTLQRIEYRLYMDRPGYYDIWLYDTKTQRWYHNSYHDTDNPPTRINWLAGSTEIDTLGGIFKDFEAHTYPITTDWVLVKGNPEPDRPNKFFVRHPDEPYQPYVYIDGWFDSAGRIITNHLTSDDI